MLHCRIAKSVSRWVLTRPRVYFFPSVVGIDKVNTPIMVDEMENEMEDEMESGVIQELVRVFILAVSPNM